MTLDQPQSLMKPNPVATLDTVSHIRVDLVNPTEEMIEIGDIAKALSLICRFGGQIPRFYSVAQHSILVQALCPPELKLEGLLHDASEAFLGDVIKPLKTLLGENYKGIEFNFETLIFQKFGLDVSRLQEVKQYDLQAYDLEDQALRQNKTQPFMKALDNAGMCIAGTEVYWRPIIAEVEFNRIFRQLYKTPFNAQ
jgi:5'-deoxynucleotidase YfbR-like HD superfamily hydrolase